MTYVMKTVFYILANFSIFYQISAVNQKALPAPPNIVFILFDDVGWADFGYNSPGQSSIPTPNIDRMAKQG